MKYNIYAIGNMRRSPEAEIFLKYSKRIKNIEFFEYVSNFEEKNKKINDESKKLLSMIKNNGKKILLDEKGKILSSSNQVKIGQTISAVLNKGSINAEVKSKDEDEN